MPDCLTNATTRASVPSEGYADARCAACHTKLLEVRSMIRAGVFVARIKCDRCKRIVELVYTD